MNILRRELKGGLRMVLVWVLIVAGLNVLMIAMHKSFSMGTEGLDEFIKAFPPAMVKAFGLDRLSMADPIGYYATEVYVIVILTGSIFGAILGASMLAKEEDEKTVEFLLAKPVSRGSVVLQKALAMVIFLLGFNIAVAVVNFGSFMALVAKEYSGATLMHLSLAPFFPMLAFGSLAFLSALVWTRRRAVYSVSLGMTMGTYALGMVSLISDKLGWLRWVSPFRYVEGADIAVDGTINFGYATALVAVSILAIGVTYSLYQRRDIAV